jgi:uncharacterized glyoxalase superfamily protein PhnB
MASAIEPHLWTDRFAEMVDWYRTALGFEVGAWFPDEATATWCQLHHGEASLMIAVTPDPETLAPSQSYLAAVADRVQQGGSALSLYLRVDDADAIHALAVAAETERIEEIWDAWWGGRQFTVADPDGNWWTVFQATDQ